MSSRAKILVQGIGNPSRGDDALGPRAIEMLDERFFGGDYDKEWVYQLQVEHAEQWSRYDIVVLIDAALNLTQAFEFKELHPGPMTLAVSSHQLPPESVLAMKEAYFPGPTRIFVLGIQAKKFDLGTGLSCEAEECLDAALLFLMKRCPSTF